MLPTRVFLLVPSVCICAVVSAAQSPTRPHALVPVPAALQFGAGRLPVTASFTTDLSGCRDARVDSATRRALDRLRRRTGLEFATPAAPAVVSASLVVSCDRPGSTTPSLSDDESYVIEVNERQASLRAPGATGVLRGLETLLQLVEGDRGGYYLPVVRIDDHPRFRWRGLLIDACRHWMPVEVIKRNLDGMAAVKLNVLHWHLTEDQGFRVESKRYPKLHSLGSDGLFYTQDQIRDVVAYAAARGIRVVPEFDMPGHVSSWLVGHPELASAPGPYAIQRTWGVFDPAFDPTREEVYRFLDGFFAEMAGLFPDEYLHIGGDENNGKQWAANPAIQAFMKKSGLADAHALQAYFNRRLAAILARHGKKMVGWDEILHPDLPKNIVVQSWRGQDSLAAGARQGYQGLLSSGYYLDMMVPAAEHYGVDPIPAGSTLTAEEQARVLGGEACMWAEWVTPENVDSRIWPRLGAIAERFWSPAAVTDVKDMYRRLATLTLRLEEVGLEHETNAGLMLRRLAGPGDLGALRVLMEVVEPVRGYRRGELHPTTQMSPLTRPVDAARPDSAVARRAAALVDALLADAPAFRASRLELADLFERWRDIRPAIDLTIDRSPVLADIRPHAETLSKAAVSGLDALSYLAARISPTDEWRTSTLASLDQAARPAGELDLAVLPALRRLVVAAAEVSKLETMTPAEWRAHVEALAKPAPPITVPLALDHNRVVIDLQMPRRDGTLRTARAWVDLWGTEVLMTEALAREVGIDLSSATGKTVQIAVPGDLRVAGAPLKLREMKGRVPLGSRWLVPGLGVDLKLPLTALTPYQVIFDYPARRVILAAPGSIPHRGARVPVGLNPANGMMQLDVVIDGEIHSLVLDGAPCTAVSDTLLAQLAARHRDWPSRAGALGAANVWGMAGEESWAMLRLPEIGLGSLKLVNTGIVGPPGFIAFYSPQALRPVSGLLGGNVLSAFRIDFDFANQAVYLEPGQLDRGRDLDLVGLTLRPLGDGGYSVLAVATADGRPAADEVRSGDLLVEIDGVPTAGADMGTVVDRLRGTPGAEHTLLLEREGRRFTVKARVQRFL